MDPHEFQIIRDFLEKKSLLLWEHEKKTDANRTFAKIGFDISKFREIEVLGRRFFVISTPIFTQMLMSVLAEACKKYPEYFGTDNTEDVLCALYKIEGIGTINEFKTVLKEEQFAWLVELNKNEVNPKVLRVELFRKTDHLKKDKTKTEFTGGVFHSFKHFTYKGVALSTKKENKNINHPSSIIDFLIQGFFFAELGLKKENEIGKNYEARFTLDTGEKICCAFYFEKESEIFFVNSVRPDPN